MYPDRQRVRDNRQTVRFDDYEADLLRALARYKGEQISTLIRDAAVREAEELFGNAGGHPARSVGPVAA